jgi:hypothetical protein
MKKTGFVPAGIIRRQKEGKSAPDKPRRLDLTFLYAFMQDGTLLHSPLSTIKGKGR